ncbi:cellulose biosynthesis cyclic di-GMP-binding regulatory protein BcsB [Patulibacter sp. SYSU D01012]|uniref:cellulose biosynthesis cyclic di-GMP-binding regulatory protein BcsB n=1 Tax=Patulibacter sp. SYSU D01012 TaxID=2817381 RepID=UPI001B30DE41
MRRALAPVALAAALAAPAARAAERPSAAAGTFADRGVPTTTVRGRDGTATAFFPLPAGYAVRGGTVDLRFEHSPLLEPRRSTVTLYAGDRPLGSARLTRETARGGRLRVALPPLPDAAGGVTLTARFSMRLTRDVCEDPDDSALWAVVRDDSTVDPRLRPADRTLADALPTLVPAADGAPLTVATDDDPASLAAAGRAVAAVGRAAGAVGADPFVQVAGAREDAAGPVLAVGTGPGLARALAGTPAPTAAPGDGVLAVRRDGTPRLALGGADARGTARAAAALDAPDALTPLPGRAALVRGPRPERPRRARAWSSDAATFAQLGIGTRQVLGPGTATVDLTVDRPPAWTITDDGTLELVVDAGAALRPDASYVTASLAGRDLGSRALRPGAGPVRLRFALPAGLLDADLDGRAVRRLPLRLRFGLPPRQERCAPRDPQGATATILDTSRITLPHDDTDARDLARFPAPLGTGGRPVDVVLPRDPAPAERTAALQVAAAIGRWAAPGAPSPRLVTADRVGDARRGQADLVLVGRADRDLGRPIAVPGGRRATGPDTGTLVLDASPWSDDGTVLAVRGADGAGLVRAARALTRASTVERLVGRAMLVVPSSAPGALAATAPGAEPPDELAPVAQASAVDDAPRWAIPAAVVLVAFVAVVLLVARRRWGGARRT